MKRQNEDFSSTSPQHDTWEEHPCPLDEQDYASLEDIERDLEANAPTDLMELEARDALYAHLLQTFNEHFQSER